MIKRNFLLITFGIILAFVNDSGYMSISAATEPQHEFVGVSKCSLCHKKEDIGEQYRIWQESKHSKAFEVLGTPEAKEIAAKQGIDNPQTSGKCLKCHSTAYWFSENKVTQNILPEEGISCETCHGAGKDYMKKSVMQDKDAAIAAGLIIPDEKVCMQCHNEQSPNYKPFDYKVMEEKIKHPIPKK